MNVRDKQKNIEYFDEFVEFDRGAADKRFADVETFPNLDGRPGRASSLVSYCFKVCVLRFGRGDEIGAIRADVWRWVEAMEIYARIVAAMPVEPASVKLMYTRVQLDTVYDAQTLLAFAVALKFDTTEIKRVLNAIGHAGEDALIDEAAKTLGDSTRKVAANSKFPKVYAGLVDVWRCAPAERASKLNDFMGKWKRNIKPIYWSNSLEGAEGAYFGYWAFDVALAVMLLGIDDTALKSNPHYPADLVAWARTR